VIRERVPAMRWILVVVLPSVLTLGCFRQDETSRCAYALIGGSSAVFGPSPQVRGRPWVTVGLSTCLQACFQGDQQRKNANAVTWTSLDPTIAEVSSAVGLDTYVTGKRVGSTVIRATIKGTAIHHEFEVVPEFRTPGSCAFR
jgi:hypothetical protein